MYARADTPALDAAIAAAHAQMDDKIEVREEPREPWQLN